MATGAVHRIQEDKYISSAQQSRLKADVQRQAKLRAELERSIATQSALVAQLKHSQEVREQAVAREEQRYVTTHYAERKIDILLQGFGEMSSVFKNIAWTSAWLMGFSVKLFLRQRVSHVSRYLKYVYWSLGLLTVNLLVHALFTSFLAIVDGTKMCYQGTKGEQDVRGALQGMMAMRSHIFWHFMFGFFFFHMLFLMCLWCKFEQDITGPAGERLEDRHDILMFGWIVSAVGWCIPTVRIVRSYRSVREDFRDDYKKELLRKVQQGNVDITDMGFALSLGPQSVRKKLTRAGVSVDDSATWVSGASGRRPSASPSSPRSAADSAGGRAPAQMGGALGLGSMPRRSFDDDRPPPPRAAERVATVQSWLRAGDK